MKKLISFSLILILILANPVAGQKGLLSKVTKSANNLLGKTENSGNQKDQPEPACASDQAVVVVKLGGDVVIDFKELAVSVLSDGRILTRNIITNQYWIYKDGVESGPFQEGDPQIADFVQKDDGSQEALLARYKSYISKSGDKYLITFAGKKYGPYAQINNFALTRAKDKFAADVTETVLMTEKQGKEIEEKMKNMTQEEQMELAMQMAQQMQQAMADGGGAESIKSKIISNIPNVGYDPMKIPNPVINGEIKYDDIVLVTWDNKIYDLQGKFLIAAKQDSEGAKNLFLSSDNTKYAFYKSGTLTFSNNTTLTEMFNPQLVKADGKVYISYMYFSPRNNAIMQHKIPF